MKLAVFVTVVALLTSIGVAQAGPWQEPTTVAEVAVVGDDDGGRAYVRLAQVDNTESCSAGAALSRVHANTAKGERMLSMLLAAKLQGLRVRVKLAGCDDSSRAVVEGVWLVQ